MHAFGALDSGTWNPFTQSLIATLRLFINPLELLASVAAVTLLDKV